MTPTSDNPTQDPTTTAIIDDQLPMDIEALRKIVTTAYHYPMWYYEHALKVQQFGSGELIPFQLNPIQYILHRIAERQLRRDGHVRLIVLKARRFGVSTWVQGRFFQRAATRENKNVMIVTHSRAATNTMFGMTRVMEENLPPILKPEVRYSGKNELVWGKLGSEYGLATVGGREVRGSKTDFLHCSEVAFWGDGGEDYLTGLLNTVVQGYQTEVVLESTANGVGGVFYQLYWDAEAGDSGFESVFIPWYCYSHYSKPFQSEQEKADFLETLGTDARYGGEEEKLLLGQEISFDLGDDDGLPSLEDITIPQVSANHTLDPDDSNIHIFTVTLENLHWRRECIRTQCQGDLDKFHQEYPSTARESFVTTGRGVFDRDALNEMYLKMQRGQREDPPMLYTIPVKRRKPDGRNAYLLEPVAEASTNVEASAAAELTVWRAPRSSREYRIGVDVSEGLEVGTRDTDYSVAVVLDAETYEECATLRTKIDPDLLAWQVCALGRWYNEALLTVESNNHGLVTLKFLQEFHNYPNLYFDKTLDERSNRATRKIGFKTSVKSKPVLVDYLRELIRERELVVRTPKLIDELQTFVFLPNGKTAAQPGSHDDCVMALALAALSCKLHPWTSAPSYRDTWHGASQYQQTKWGVYIPPSI